MDALHEKLTRLLIICAEPIQQHTSVHKNRLPDPVKDNFEVPPTPEQLLNDICSDFSKITIKGYCCFILLVKAKHVQE